MSGEIPALQVTDDGQLELAAITAALAAEYAVATGVKRRVHRRRLNTFDRRLHAAGLRLEHRSLAPVKGSKRGRRHGSRVAVPVTAQRWPEPADVLPDPVRDVVATVTGVRALVVTSDKVHRVARLELNNQEGETVARVELDQPASAAPAKPMAARFAWVRRTAARGRALIGTVGVAGTTRITLQQRG